MQVTIKGKMPIFMSTTAAIIENVTYSFLHRDNLIICTSNKGINLYKAGKLINISEIAPWYACIFRDYLLFQPINGGDIYYLQPDSDAPDRVHCIEGSFYLFRAMIDGDRIYIPIKENLVEFDLALNPTGTYTIGRFPHMVNNQMYYRVNPHLGAFSLHDQRPIWTMENEDFKQPKGAIPGYYMFKNNGHLIVISEWKNNFNYLTAFNPDNGAINWQLYGYYAGVAFLENKIYVFYYLNRFVAERKVAAEGKIMTIDPRTGQILLDMVITEELIKNGFRISDHYFLSIKDEYLYIAAAYGKMLYTFNLKTFQIIWKYSFSHIEAGWISDLKQFGEELFLTDELENMHVINIPNPTLINEEITNVK